MMKGRIMNETRYCAVCRSISHGCLAACLLVLAGCPLLPPPGVKPPDAAQPAGAGGRSVELVLRKEFAGAATAGSPLYGATVQVESDGQVLPGTTTTGPDGSWRSLLMPPGEAAFRVMVTGGEQDSTPFEGTLSAWVPRNDISLETDPLPWALEEIPVNIRTTLVDRYMAYSGADFKTAMERVAAFLEIPEENHVLDIELPFTVYAPEIVLMESAFNGGLDTYIDGLVTRIGTGDTEPMLANNPWQILEVTFGTWLGKTVTQGLGGAAGSFVLGKTWAALLPALGFETFEQSVQNQLADIKNKLNDIDRKIDTLNSKVDDLLDAIATSRDLIINEIARQRVNEAVQIIDNQFYNMINIEIPAGQDCNVSGTAAYIEGLPDIDQAIYNLHDGICGQGDALKALTTVLLYEVTAAEYGRRGEALLSAYSTLEKYFGDIIATKMQGVAIMVNLLNYQEYLPDEEKIYIGTAEGYYTGKIQDQIDREIDTFLYQIERLVAAAIDVRTVTAGDFAMVPPEALTIFRRADFIAQQFSSEHEDGFVLRVIGDPAIADKFHTAPANADDFGAAEYVVINGQDVREFDAYYPEYYGKNYYYGWSNAAPAYAEFSRQTKVSFTKIVFPDFNARIGADYRDRAPFRKWYQYYTGLGFSALFERRNAESGSDAAPREDTDVVLGVGLMTARNLPRFKRCETQD
jgi:hypothetical protein